MTIRRLARLQWVGLLAGATTWTVAHLAGIGITQAECNAIGGRWGLSNPWWQGTVMAAAATLVVVAEGGYVTGAIPPPLEDATPTQVAEAVRIGPNVMPRFSTKAITPKELNSLVAYVEYTKHPDDRGGWALGHLGPVPEGLVAWLLAAAALVFACMTIGTRLHRG